MEIPLFQVDAFTDRALRGNPAAVMPLESWLPDELLQAIADENHLSETAFLVPSSDDEVDFEIRWFTPLAEMDLCGHATLASGHVLFEHLGFAGDTVRLSGKLGAMSVSREGELLVLDFPARRATQVEIPAELPRILGAEPLEVHRARSFLVVFADESTVRGLDPDIAGIAGLDVMSVLATAPGDDANVDFVSRYFAPRVGIDEDPVTGSAHCTSAPYWAERFGRDELVAHQVSARGGVIHCRVRGERVLIGGRATTYLTGVARVPYPR